MRDLPLQNLLHQLHSQAATGEHLEVLGKQAAAEWCQGKHKNLTDAVAGTVKHAGLAPEQVRRVVEFANVAAFNREFQKEAAPHRVITFPGGPADAGLILQDLNDRGAVATYTRGLSDYHGPPPERMKTASAQAEAALVDSFAGDSLGDPIDNPLGAAIDTWDKLSAIRDRLTTELGGLEVMFHDLTERLFHEVKQATLNGASLGEILQAWETVAPDGQYIKIAFSHLAPRLLTNGVFPSLVAMEHSLDKIASARTVNPRHPIVSEFSDFCEALSKLAETRATRDVVVEHIAPIQQLLKIAASGGLLPEAWRAYKGVVGDVGRHVGNAVEAVYNNPAAPGVVGDKANKAFQVAAKYVAPALATRHVYKNYVEPNPVYQTVSQEVSGALLPNTPGTAQFYGGYGGYGY